MTAFRHDIVLIYSHHAPPQPSACATRTLSLARYLRERGIKVGFLTSKSGPTLHDGFSILRCRGRFGLMRTLCRHPRCPIIVTSPPATPAAEVAFVSRVLGYRVVVDIRDPFVSEALHNGEISPGPTARLKLMLEKSLFRSPHVVSYVSDALRNKMSQSFGNPSCQQVIAPNGVDRDIFNLNYKHRDNTRRKLKIESDVVFVYAGILGGKSLDKALTALAPALRRGAKLLIIAVLDEYSQSIYEELKAQAQTLGIADHIIWKFNLTAKEVAAYLNASDIGVNPLPFNRSYCLPVKTFEFLACGVHPLNIVGNDSALLSIFNDNNLSSFCFSWQECTERACSLMDNLPELRGKAKIRSEFASQFDREKANTILMHALLRGR